MIRVASYGLGPIGVAAARLALQKTRLQFVGAVDIDPDVAGQDLGEILGDSKAAGIRVHGEAEALFADARPDVVIHCTSSFLPVVVDQFVGAARAGVNVVSSTEEMLVPDLQHPELAARIDEAAREGGATVLGTGVNPGFCMDFMAMVASGVVHRVDSVRCVRVVDAGTRRLPLQRKVGASLSTEQFAEQEKTGRFGHIGMRESVALVGRALGFELDEIEQTLEPVIAEREHVTPHLTVPAGAVAGIHNVGIGRCRGETLVELDLSMFVGAAEPRDEVNLHGDPDLQLVFPGGVPGDPATAAVLVNSIPQVVAAAPGLATILDLPPPRVVR